MSIVLLNASNNIGLNLINILATNYKIIVINNKKIVDHNNVAYCNIDISDEDELSGFLRENPTNIIIYLPLKNYDILPPNIKKSDLFKNATVLP